VTLVSYPPGTGEYPRICSDGHGGAFVAWRDLRDHLDVFFDRIWTSYITHLDSRGLTPSGIPFGGVRVLPNASALENFVTDMTPDGAGGCYVVVARDFFHDSATGQTHSTQVLFRFTADCTPAPGWPAAGVTLFDGGDVFNSDAVLYRVAQDGVYVIGSAAGPAVQDTFRLRVQFVRGDGTLDPSYPTGGRRIGIGGSASLGGIVYPVVPDGHGGMFIAYGLRPDNSPGVMIQHLLQDGTIAPGFGPMGNPAPFPYAFTGMVASAGGVIVAGFGAGADALYGDLAFFTLGLDSLAQVRPAWSGGPKQLMPDPVFIQSSLLCVSDDFGGMFLTWTDSRDYYHYGQQSYVERIGPDGEPSPGWPVGGVPEAYQPGFQLNGGRFSNSAVSDGSGGVYMEFTRSGAGTYVSHVVSPGVIAPGWSPLAEPHILGNDDDFQGFWAICTDGHGGAIVALNTDTYVIAAQHVGPVAPVAAEATLVSADAQSDRVTLEWRLASSTDGSVSIERSASDATWSAVGSVLADGTGSVHFEDRSVTAGSRYSYRIRYRVAGLDRTSAATEVVVPAAAHFALHGARPDPAPRGQARVAFALEGGASARLELYGVDGARRFARDVTSLGAGEHVIALDDGRALAPGLYWLRLTQGTRTATSRMVIVGS
jgi:hypothetical protein